MAIHAKNLWPFVRAMQQLEHAAFGAQLHEYRKEIKGCKLLDKDRYKWAAQDSRMKDEERRKHSRGFLTRGLESKRPSRDEFTAYGQACLEMATGTFQLLREFGAVLFAAAIPRGVRKPASPLAATNEFLRKDHVFLLERYFHFLEHQKEHGLLVMDEVEKKADRRFVRQLDDYFSKTKTGRYRSTWIVPVPFFVSSDMTYPIQAADLAIYCVNWGFRLPTRGMSAPTRNEIAADYGQWMHQLQFRGDAPRDGTVYEQFGIVYVPDPYTPRST